MTINPPTLGGNYERYKQELKAWQIISDIPKEKQGITIALTLPENHTSGIRGKVFEEVQLSELQKDTGLNILIGFLDKHLGRDDIVDQYEKFADFEDFKRGSDNIFQYIANFHQRYHRLEKLNMKLPTPVLAFKLLKCANLTKEEMMLVMTGMNFEEKEKLYDQAKSSLKKFMGDHGMKRETTVEFDAAFLAENEEVLIATGYERRPARWSNNYRRKWKDSCDRPRHDEEENITRAVHSDQRSVYRRMNPNGSDGKPLLCKACGSYRHFIAQCPYSWENQQDPNVQITEQEEENVVLFTTSQSHMGSISEIGIEARNAAILDSACSSTVCGQKWMNEYKNSLNSEDLKKIVVMDGKKRFKFGGGIKLKSLGSYIIPIELAGKKLSLKTDVVDAEIPLLLSKSSMKRAKIKLNTENDTADILGVKVNIRTTTSGHYCVPVIRNESRLDHVRKMNLPDIAKNRHHDKTIMHNSAESMQIKRTSTANYQDSCIADWKHVIIRERVCNRTTENTSMYKVVDQITNRAFSLDLDSLTPGTRLIRA